MTENEKLLRNQRIIIVLIFAVLAINIVFILLDRIPPTGRFAGASMGVSECSLSGLKLTGFGDSDDLAYQSMLAKQENYASLYCNGKFKDDPDTTAIPGLGCSVCRPKCTPAVTDASAATFNRTRDGIEASKTVTITCV